MQVIGLVGPKGSGKDTSYEILRDAKRVDGKISFAGPLKAVCGEVFGLHFNLLNDPDLKERPLKEPITLTRKQIKAILFACVSYVNPVTEDGRVLYSIDRVSVVGLEGRCFKTPRELLQIIGTELIRDRVYKSWHKEAAFSEKALAKLKKAGTYAVTDVRFVDEHEFLSAKYGDAYRGFYVDRPQASKALEESVASGTAHPSETQTQAIRELLKASVIDNSGDLDYLKAVLEELELPEAPAKASASASRGSRFRFGQKDGAGPTVAGEASVPAAAPKEGA